MTSLVIAEHNNKVLKDSTAKTVAAAAQLGQPVHVLVAGQDAGAVADAASKLAGVEKVLLADDAIYARMVAEPMETLILSLAPNYDAILAPATTNGKNYMPRVAAKLDVPQISEILSVQSPDTFTRPIYAGNAIQTVQAPAGKKVITVRTTAFKAAEGVGSASVEKIASAGDTGISKFVGEELSKSERPELTSAKIIISGGRGMQSGRISICSTRSPTSCTPPSARRARPSMRASCPTIIRWARPARSWRRSFTSPSAFPARSSIWQA